VTQGVPMTRTAAQLGISGSSSFDSMTASLSYPQFTVSFFVPKAQPSGALDLHFKITQGGPQAITATPAMASGSPGIPGTVVVMTAQHIAMGVNRSMYDVGVNTLVAIPLGVGRAGQVVRTFTAIGVPQYMTVDFLG
jgi:hypothetical protein